MAGKRSKTKPVVVMTRRQIRDRREDLEAEIDSYECELASLQSECPHPLRAIDKDGLCGDCGDWLHHEDVQVRKDEAKAKRRRKVK